MPPKQPTTQSPKSPNLLNPFGKKTDEKQGLPTIRDMDGEKLHALIYEAATIGGVISIGVTRDTGAAVLGILVNNEQHKEYAKSPEELNSLMDTLNDWLKSF